MDINSFLKKDLCLFNKSYKSKDDALKDFSKILKEKGYAKSGKTVLELALERENQISTGIGEKIATPHIRDDVMKESVILFATVKPLDWKSLDNVDVEVIFFIAMNKSEGENSHLEVISSLSKLFMERSFVEQLIKVKTYSALKKLLNDSLAPPTKSELQDDLELSSSHKDGPNPHYDIVAVTACPTGIAHTFMAAKKLEDTAKEMKVSIKVETQGTEGQRNTLTQEEIDNAKGVIIAVDKIIDTSRFNGHENVLEMGTKAVIKDARKEINRALNKEGKKMEGSKPKSNASSFDDSGDQISFKNFGKRIYKSLMTGVSYMLPFVVFGGILIALAFLIDINNPNVDEGGLGSGFAGNYFIPKWFKSLGDLSFGMMVPILCAYIAYALIGKIGLLPGFICGLISSGKFLFNINIESNPISIQWLEPSKVSSGFFGAIFGGIYSSVILIAIMKYILHKMPQSLNPIKNILLIPLFGTLFIAASFWIANIPLIFLNWGFQELLRLIESNKISALLGLIIGIMMAVDLGGPINKAAYLFATATLGSSNNNGGTISMAAAMAAGMVPPLGIALSCTFFRKMWNQDQKSSGYTNYIMGLSFVSEGAIPFTVENPKVLVPSNIIGGGIAGLLTGAFEIQLNAPHGGVFVLPLVKSDFYGLFKSEGVKIGGGIALYLGAIIIGSIASMLMIWGLMVAFKKRQNKSNLVNLDQVEKK